MIRCPRCQQENRQGRRFCAECGASLALACPSCGFSNEPGEKFCGGCGQLLGSSQAPTAKAPSPESYTPKHLAEKILISKAALEGERKQVTVLFADLKGSMELLADRDPEEARQLLDPVIEHMMEAIHWYEGTVNQVMGDGIMALFGAPLAHEDDAARACYAALRMQESVKRYAEGVRRQEGITVRIRVGLNSGEVVVRAIGSDLHMDYTAVGQTTHLAARMEQLADPGTVLLTPATLALAEDFIQVRPQGPTPVKGMSEPVEVYELVGATSARSRFHAHAARGLTAFVGRTSEMGQLAEALELARDGRGQVVALVGEPGVGKSRLFWEFGHSHWTGGCLVLESASVSYGKATPYLPVIELLRAYFQIEPRDGTRTVREKVTGKLLSLDRALEVAVPPLSSLLDLPVEDDAWARFDPAQRRQRILDALKRLLLRESQVQPLVLVFEDLHWIDGETQAVLDGLVESLPTARAMLLVNYRPEYRHGWGSKTYYRQQRIDALAGPGVDALLDALVGRDPALIPLRAMLVGRTGGNPFFIEESVRTLVEAGTLVGKPGGYRSTQPVDRMQIPASVEAVLAARIDRLDPEDKKRLQAAAVVGKDVSFALLSGVVGDDEADLRLGLGRLQAAEFLYETRMYPDLEYTFKHALTHEVAYAGVLHERRRRLHVQIVTAIEDLSAGRLEEYCERLAHHAFRAEEWDKAVRYGRDAAARALARSANREATAYVEQALQALSHLPEGPRTCELAVDLRLDLYRTLLPLDELRPLLGHLRDAERLAQALGDSERLGWARLHVSHVLTLVDETRAGLEVAEDAVRLAEAVGNWRMAADAHLWRGCCAYALGQHRRAIGALRTGVSVREAHAGTRDLMAQSGYVAMFFAELGEFADAEQAAAITLRSLLTPADRPWNVLNACWQLAWGFGLRGDLDRAIPLAEQAIETCRQWGFLRTLGTAMSLLGHLLTLAGRATEGVTLLEEGHRQADGFGFTWLRGQRLNHLAEAYLRTGRAGDAEMVASEALAFCRRRGERGFEAWALRTRAEITLAAKPLDASFAATTYHEALALATELEMRPLVAHCHLGLGKLYRRTGQREQAHGHLSIATTMYREMDMRLYLEQAEAELRDLGEGQP